MTNKKPKKEYISKDKVIINPAKKEQSYQEFKIDMLKSYGSERWKVIESFLWTEPKKRIEENQTARLGTINQLMSGLGGESTEWWQDELEELAP